MSDCLHCDIHEMDIHLPNEQADLREIASRVTEVLADLILLAPPADQAMVLAAVVTNLGGVVLEKNQETDPNSPGHSAHRCGFASWLEAVMTAEPVTKKRTLWQAVVVMFFVSCLLTVSGVVGYFYDGHPSIFSSLQIFFGVCGVLVTLVAWLLTVLV